MQDDGQCVFVKVDLGPTNRKELDFAHYFAKFDLLILSYLLKVMI